MTGEDYYYFFSIIPALSLSIYLVNVLYFKISGKTVFRHKHKLNAVAYRGLGKLTGNVPILIASLATAAFVGNAVYSGYLVARINTTDALFFLFIAPIFCTVLFIITFAVIRKQS